MARVCIGNSEWGGSEGCKEFWELGVKVGKAVGEFRRGFFSLGTLFSLK